MTTILFGWLLGGILNGVPGAEGFGDGPGLGDATAWRVRRLSVEDFSQGSQSVIVEMVGHRFEIGKGRARIAIHAMVRQHKGAKEPTPDGALMIGAVPIPDISTILSHILRIVRSQAA